MAVSHPLHGATWDNAGAYDGFMGRFSLVLAPQLAELAGVAAGQRVLDVGCGTGALTGELVRRVGPGTVAAIDPSEQFVAAAAGRCSGVALFHGVSERLPFPDDSFDVTLAQLAVGHMDDPAAGLAEMARVTRCGGVVAICDWRGGPRREDGPHGPFWLAAAELAGRRSSARRRPPFTPPAELLRDLGLDRFEETSFHASVDYEGFDQWWTAVAEGVGTSGGYAKSLGPEGRMQLRERCRAKLPEGPFAVEAVARAARGVVP